MKWKQKHKNSNANSKWLWLFSKEIDVIIAPGFTFPAPPVKHPARLVPAVSYTAAYNVLDFPVGSVPITRVIPQDEVCQYYLINYSLEAIFDCFLLKIYRYAPCNVLDFPVGSVPITRVIPQDEVCQYCLINYSLEAIFDCFWSKFTEMSKSV